MKCNKVISFIVGVITLLFIMSSCRTDKERSRRLLERANRLYPIEFTKDTLLKVDTVLAFDTTVVIQKDSFQIEGKIQKDSVGNFITFKDKILLDNNKVIVKGTLDKVGELKVSVFIKEKKQALHLNIPFKYQVITKRMYYKSPPEIIKVHGVFWWTGIFFYIGLVGFAVFRYFFKR